MELVLVACHKWGGPTVAGISILLIVDAAINGFIVNVRLEVLLCREQVVIVSEDLQPHATEVRAWRTSVEGNSPNLYSIVTRPSIHDVEILLTFWLLVVGEWGCGPAVGTFACQTSIQILENGPTWRLVADPPVYCGVEEQALK